MARLLIVSNRLPVTVAVEGGRLRVERSAGGLATGLRGPHQQSGGLWIGWPGTTCDDLDAPLQEELERRLAALDAVPVLLSAEEVRRYYEGVCNGTLWPLFHYLVGQLPMEIDDFDVYEAVNERFAAAVAARYEPGDLIWVHDYQLMLVPAMLRDRLPGARIGFFLHIPFPTAELFRVLPYRERLLSGLLGADLVGFHTAAYMRHFGASALRVLGAGTEAVDRIAWAGHHVRLGVFPMGVDAAAFAAMAEEPEVRAEVARLRDDTSLRVLVGIDRLDYTKGIPRRLLAFERLLERHPELRERVRLIQVAVPSRTSVDAYQEFRAQVDGLIGRIHGVFATPTWTPIHYIFRGLSEREVAALYAAADVMLVTPIRDGMNLVAKEFVAARTDEDGVLVLSEFAGAASELAGAVLVNPYDIEGTAEAFYRALAMSADERRTRMHALRRVVATFDVHRWARTFLDVLAEPLPPGPTPAAVSPASEVARTIALLRAAPELVLLLDYDGTLVPFAATPDLAAPDPALRELLHALAGRARTRVHIVSGRLHDTLEQWLGDLPIGLHGEHGAWSRVAGGSWHCADLPDLSWRAPARKILEHFTSRTPGALIEDKTAGLAWHYRLADPEYATFRANELRLHLRTVLGNEPVEILDGAMVIELRPHSLHKGRLLPAIAAAAPPGTVMAALGDDRTDEDLFAALPPGAIAVRVGSGRSQAALRLADYRAARALLAALL